MMLLFVYVILPTTLLAADSVINYVPLANLPSFGQNGENITGPNFQSNFQRYLLAVYRTGIGIAGILSVLMLVVAGFQYSTTDAISGKEEAKGKITNVLWGLGLILVSYLMLNTVNKATLSLNLDFKATSVRVGDAFGAAKEANYAALLVEQARIRDLARVANSNASAINLQLQRKQAEIDNAQQDDTLAGNADALLKLEKEKAELVIQSDNVSRGADVVSLSSIATMAYLSTLNLKSGDVKNDKDIAQYQGQAKHDFDVSTKILDEKIVAAQLIGDVNTANQATAEKEYYAQMYKFANDTINDKKRIANCSESCNALKTGVTISSNASAEKQIAYIREAAKNSPVLQQRAVEDIKLIRSVRTNALRTP